MQDIKQKQKNPIKNIVHTVEGNSNDECNQKEYSKDDNQIMGYGRPLF